LSVRAAVAVVVAFAGCGETASNELGLGDLLYVDGAQYRPGALPSANGGPAVLQAFTAHPMIVIGTNREPLSGVLAADARAVVIGIRGARGAWIVPAGPPDVDTPGLPSLHATFGLGAALPVGLFELDVAAVDAQGRVGDAMPIELVATFAAPPDGDLVIALEWESTADLDLHVVDPAGEEAWQGHPNTWQVPPPGTPGIDPCAWASGGILDRDANAGCVRDGAPAEHVVWTTRACNGMQVAPALMTGAYVVRVEASSMCSDASAAWTVTVLSAGQIIATARGVATQADVDYGTHGPGAGVLALGFEL
jgi:hypothetical protein